MAIRPTSMTFATLNFDFDYSAMNSPDNSLSSN
jgi:hypothetical protein